MTIRHIGNNWYVGYTSEGDSVSQMGNIENAIYISPEDKTFSHCHSGFWSTISFNSSSDQLAASITIPMTKPNVGTTYQYLYPAFYDNVPMGIDTRGFNKIGIALFWNKNGGAGRHDILIVDKANPTGTPLINSAPLENGLISGVNKTYDIDLPTEFQNFRGEVVAAVKSTVGTDSPICDGIFLYLIR